MSKNRDILKLREGLLNLLKEGDKFFSGEVTAADASKYTCTVKLPNEMELYDVQLKALKNAQKGCVLLPKVGSTVWMQALSEADFLVVSIEDVDKIILKPNDLMEVTVPELMIDAGKTLGMSSEDIQLNGDTYGGLVIVGNLVDRMNAVEQALIEVKSMYNTHTHPYVDSGGAPTPVTSVTTMLLTETVTPTVESDIENTNVKHG